MRITKKSFIDQLCNGEQWAYQWIGNAPESVVGPIVEDPASVYPAKVIAKLGTDVYQYTTVKRTSGTHYQRTFIRNGESVTSCGDVAGKNTTVHQYTINGTTMLLVHSAWETSSGEPMATVYAYIKRAA